MLSQSLERNIGRHVSLFCCYLSLCHRRATRLFLRPKYFDPTSTHLRHSRLSSRVKMYAKRQSASSRSLNSIAGPSSYSGGGGGGGEVATYPRSGNYPHRLNFYETPPTEEITLEEFEVWAIDRLRRKLSLSLSFSSHLPTRCLTPFHSCTCVRVGI